MHRDLRGLKRQLTIDGVISTKFLGSIEPEEESCEELVSEYADELWGEFYDVSGNALESGKEREARAEEIQGLKTRPTYQSADVRVLGEDWKGTYPNEVRRCD